MTAYNAPTYFISNGFNLIFYTSTNTNNYLTYPVSQLTNETFLGSVAINQNLNVSGTSNLNNTLTLGTSSTNSTINLNSSGGAGQVSIYTDNDNNLNINPPIGYMVKIGNADGGSDLNGFIRAGPLALYNTTLTTQCGLIDNVGNAQFNSLGTYNNVNYSINAGTSSNILLNDVSTGTVNIQNQLVLGKISTTTGSIKIFGAAATTFSTIYMDTAIRLNIISPTGGAIQLNNTNPSGNVLLYGTITQGPTAWRSTTLTLATIANMDGTGNLFCNSVSNFGATYVTKTINQTGYFSGITTSNVSMNAIVSNQALSTNIVTINSFTLQPGSWIVNANYGFNILTGPAVITSYKFGMSGSTAFDSSIGNITNHTSQTYAVNDVAQFTSSFTLNNIAAMTYYILGTTIYSSGTFNLVGGYTLMRIA